MFCNNPNFIEKSRGNHNGYDYTIYYSDYFDCSWFAESITEYDYSIRVRFSPNQKHCEELICRKIDEFISNERRRCELRFAQIQEELLFRTN
jgi:hypothetical protein